MILKILTKNSTSRYLNKDWRSSTVFSRKGIKEIQDKAKQDKEMKAREKPNNERFSFKTQEGRGSGQGEWQTMAPPWNSEPKLSPYLSSEGSRVTVNSVWQEKEIKPTTIKKFKRSLTIRIISKYFKTAMYKINNKIQYILQFICKEEQNMVFEQLLFSCCAKCPSVHGCTRICDC